MNKDLIEEGLAYAERNLWQTNTHLMLDKQLINTHFDLKGKTALDFGCGMGGTALWLAKEHGAIVDAVDIEDNHIEVANILNEKYKIPNVTFELKNIIENPVDKQYDFVFLTDVIEHIKPEWIPGILDILIKRNLKKNGVLYFSYPPWEGPKASHLHRITKIPWIQFFPKQFVLNKIKKNNVQLVSGKDLLSEYIELNHMTHKKLMHFLKPFGLELIFRKSYTKFTKIPLLKNVNLNFFPFSYLVAKEMIAFRKIK